MTGIASIAFHQEEHSKADVTSAARAARRCGEVEASFGLNLRDCLGIGMDHKSRSCPSPFGRRPRAVAEVP